MPLMLLIDPRAVGVDPAFDPASRWGATTVRGAAVANAVAALDRVVVVAAPTDHSAIAAELAAFVGFAGRQVLNEPTFAESATAALMNITSDSEPVLVGWLDQPTATAALWRRLEAVELSEHLVAATAGVVGDRCPSIVAAIHLAMLPKPVPSSAVELGVWASLQRTLDRDEAYVEECLGRTPQVAYSVAARRDDGRPAVIENPPFMADGRPMPTTFWLIDPEFNKRIGTLEADGGVDTVEEVLGLDVMAEVHDRYRTYRDSLIPPDYEGYRPSGGVGGTRVGVKCLHTHYAWYLAGGDDPVGAWVQERLDTSEATA